MDAGADRPLPSHARRDVLVTGASGYLGRELCRHLAARGHRVRALVRAAAQVELAGGVEVIVGDALDARSIGIALEERATLVQLVGTRRPAPWKKELFRAIDRTSALAALEAAVAKHAEHYVYLSVAQPAPIMRAYVDVRAECEAAIARSGLRATFVRPWYVLGPGHRWPLVLAPMYAVLERLPMTRVGAERLGLVKLEDMLRTLVDAVEHPPEREGDVRLVETAQIRARSVSSARRLPQRERV